MAGRNYFSGVIGAPIMGPQHFIADLVPQIGQVVWVRFAENEWDQWKRRLFKSTAHGHVWAEYDHTDSPAVQIKDRPVMPEDRWANLCNKDAKGQVRYFDNGKNLDAPNET